MKINFILSENLLIRLSISGGMSLRGGFHVDLVYSLDLLLLKSSLVVPAKNVERWMSRRSRARVLDSSEFVYFGVWMNLNPRPRTSRVCGGTIC